MSAQRTGVVERPRRSRSRRAAAARVPEHALVDIDGAAHVRITAVEALPPFLMNVPTDTDLWMFLTSNGGVTAGRCDPDGALFPYETVDRLYDAPFHAGPVTLVRWRRGARAPGRWAPLAPGVRLRAARRRSLAKTTLGHQVLFEELDHEAALAFRCRWAGSEDTGWVRTASLTNLGSDAVRVRVLDGFRHLLPAGALLRLTQQSSCLLDAYTRVDVDAAVPLATVSLTARVTDRPEPAEELRATVAWCHGLPDVRVALSPAAIEAFRAGRQATPEQVRTGQRAHYLVTSAFTIPPGGRVEWHLGADTGRRHADIARVRRQLADGHAGAWIEDALARAGDGLRRIVAATDGLQRSGRPHADLHHLANVLYNDLRGGVFVHDHRFPRRDFEAFVTARDPALAARHAATVAALPERPTIAALHEAAHATGDPDLRRAALEYLPLWFGRRHGDPSRPWNRFSIVVRHDDGSRALRYEGNWRDLFQNWEALASGFPGFLPGMVARFLNASTLDGHNPYRITREGAEWEVPDAHDPWSGIGYWGDHQIAYLRPLLEAWRDHAPGALERMLGEEVFAYTDVPYRLASYPDMLRAPRATVTFDAAHHDRVMRRIAERGLDGALVRDADGGVRHASLLEKLLVPALAKMSSFVPGGGIWMNTQRPEWNDANNALAGDGLSVVTTCHLRRHLAFLEDLLAGPASDARVSIEVLTWLRRMSGILERAPDDADGSPESRGDTMDALGHAFSVYREQLEAHGLTERVLLSHDEVRAWCRGARAHVEYTIRSNQRDDGLYHAYNLLELDGPRRHVHRLPLMLEGQVAALTSGMVRGHAAVALLDALFASPLHRRGTFVLYPERALPAFMERNRVPPEAETIPLVQRLLAAGERSLIERDVDGRLRFAPTFANARDAALALDRLSIDEAWRADVARDRDAVLALYEQVFQHRTFTGRSGAMYGYEGIGCVYWHMVAKLLLAVQQVLLAAREDGEPAEVCAALERAYLRIRAGLGFERPVGNFGAFPSDPYSHSPAHAGAQQPGMTGQVKEEILARFGELGVQVRNGCVAFEPLLLTRADFLAAPEPWSWIDLAGVERRALLPAGSLAFTYGQVPVVYTLTRDAAGIRVTGEGGLMAARPGGGLTPAESAALLGRDGAIARIDVAVPEHVLHADHAATRSGA